jgi:hypothetical protein
MNDVRWCGSSVGRLRVAEENLEGSRYWRRDQSDPDAADEHRGVVAVRLGRFSLGDCRAGLLGSDTDELGVRNAAGFVDNLAERRAGDDLAAFDSHLSQLARFRLGGFPSGCGRQPGGRHRVVGVEQARNDDLVGHVTRSVQHQSAVVLDLQHHAGVSCGAGGPDRNVARGDDHQVAVGLHAQDGTGVTARVEHGVVVRRPGDRRVEVAVDGHPGEELAAGRRDRLVGTEAIARVELELQAGSRSRGGHGDAADRNGHHHDDCHDDTHNERTCKAHYSHLSLQKVGVDSMIIH